MANPVPYCIGCRRNGHWLPECPERKPIAKLGEVARVKKAWGKPKLTRWIKAEEFTPSSQVVHKVDSVNSCEQSTVHKDRKEYRREWMRKKRDEEKANRVG